MTTLAQIQTMLPGSRLINISDEHAQLLEISQVATDSRKIDAGELFIPLAGDRFDAHDFLADIANSGAAAALISSPEKCPPNLAAICVEDSKVALGQLAKAWRATFSIPVALVTGSNGKTTVKEMIASIFKAAVGNECALITQGNLNNDIGLPLTLLRLRHTDRLAVVELGMNHPGETAELAKIAQANIVLINNAQREHQEFMATVDAVAHEHSDALRALPTDGVAVFPADSEFTDMWRRAAGTRKVIDFALTSHFLDNKAFVTGCLMGSGRVKIATNLDVIEVQLNTLGNHNVRNALAASAVALAAGISLEKIKEGLEAFAPVNGRMQFQPLVSNITLIDDSYNANPDSVRAAIDALKQSGQLSWLILGDMGEVGDQGPAFHEEVGAYAAEQSIARLFALGEQSQFTVRSFDELKNERMLLSKAEGFTSVELLITNLLNALKTHKANEKQHLNILVKGSRFMRMERVAQALLKEANTCS